jgi:hypothetical protein
MYKIEVERSQNEGRLHYTGTINVSTTCWWDPQRKIPAGTYANCSATYMATKQNSAGGPREAIYIPSIPGFSGIFIHMGNNASWSDGCIVIREPEMLRIFADINPKDGRNVTVTVR